MVWNPLCSTESSRRGDLSTNRTSQVRLNIPGMLPPTACGTSQVEPPRMCGISQHKWDIPGGTTLHVWDIPAQMGHPRWDYLAHVGYLSTNGTSQVGPQCVGYPSIDGTSQVGPPHRRRDQPLSVLPGLFLFKVVLQAPFLVQLMLQVWYGLNFWFSGIVGMIPSLFLPHHFG
jgi:hypothetical protein